MADDLWNNGIRHIVALRGDIPKVDAPLNYSDPTYYHYAYELIAGFLAQHPFEISVAAYPEKHPEAPDLATDIANLTRKCEAGATRAITQFFFDNQVFLRFRDQASAAGILTPIVPGVIPVLDYDRMIRFAGTCQASVPDAVKSRLEPLKSNQTAFAEAASELQPPVRRTGKRRRPAYPFLYAQSRFPALQSLPDTGACALILPCNISRVFEQTDFISGQEHEAPRIDHTQADK